MIQLYRYFTQHRRTGQRSITIASNTQDACRKLGWLMDDCTAKRKEELHPYQYGPGVHIPKEK